MAAIANTMAAVRDLAPATPKLLTLDGPTGLHTKLRGFAHDFSRSQIGRAHSAFEAARGAFARWVQFDLGWVRVLNNDAPIDLHQLVLVQAHTAGLWSINVSRIVEFINLPHRFGFVYATTELHAEEGEERFVVELDNATGAVNYTIEAFSRPRHPLARLAYPFTRAMQHRFSRESHLRLREAVSRDNGCLL